VAQISRLVASRSALAIRVDALAENATREVGEEGYRKVENRLRLLEGGRIHTQASKGRTKHLSSYDHTKSAQSPAAPRATTTYNEAVDNTIKVEPVASTPTTPKKQKKEKKGKKKIKEEKEEAMEVVEQPKEKKKKKKGSKSSQEKEGKKRKREEATTEEQPPEKDKTSKKEKKKKKKTE